MRCSIAIPSCHHVDGDDGIDDDDGSDDDDYGEVRGEPKRSFMQQCVVVGSVVTHAIWSVRCQLVLQSGDLLNPPFDCNAQIYVYAPIFTHTRVYVLRAVPERSEHRGPERCSGTF